MAIALPNFSRSPRAVQWGFEANVQEHSSPGTNAVQTQELPGTRWLTSITWRLDADTEARIMEAWLGELNGRAGRALLHNMRRPVPRGVGGGTPLVNGAGQSGKTIVIDGAPASTTGWLLAGDYVGIGGRVYLLKSNVNTDAGGNASLVFTFGYRGSTTDNAPVTLIRPTTTFLLVSNRQAWASGPGRGSVEFTLDFEEDPQ